MAQVHQGEGELVGGWGQVTWARSLLCTSRVTQPLRCSSITWDIRLQNEVPCNGQLSHKLSASNVPDLLRFLQSDCPMVNDLPPVKAHTLSWVLMSFYVTPLHR